MMTTLTGFKNLLGFVIYCSIFAVSKRRFRNWWFRNLIMIVMKFY